MSNAMYVLAYGEKKLCRVRNSELFLPFAFSSKVFDTVRMLLGQLAHFGV